jgi:hypothetical protein
VLFKVSKRNRSKLQHYLWRWPPDLENWSQWDMHTLETLFSLRL